METPINHNNDLTKSEFAKFVKCGYQNGMLRKMLSSALVELDEAKVELAQLTEEKVNVTDAERIRIRALQVYNDLHAEIAALKRTMSTLKRDNSVLIAKYLSLQNELHK